MPEIIDLTFIEDEQRRVQVADDMALVYDGLDNSGVNWRWDHICETIGDPAEGHVIKRIAPYLSPGHRIISEEPLTIVGSLMCPSCKLHGFIRDSRWVLA